MALQIGANFLVLLLEFDVMGATITRNRSRSVHSQARSYGTKCDQRGRCSLPAVNIRSHGGGVLSS